MSAKYPYLPERLWPIAERIDAKAPSVSAKAHVYWIIQETKTEPAERYGPIISYSLGKCKLEPIQDVKAPPAASPAFRPAKLMHYSIQPNDSVWTYAGITKWVFDSCCGLQYLERPSNNNLTVDEYWEFVQAILAKDYIPAMITLPRRGGYPHETFDKYCTTQRTFRNGVHNSILTTYSVDPDWVTDYISDTECKIYDGYPAFNKLLGLQSHPHTGERL